MELTFVDDLKRDLNDYNGIVGAIQFTNASDYQGYKLTTQMGLEIEHRNPKGTESETLTRSFIAVVRRSAIAALHGSAFPGRRRFLWAVVGVGLLALCLRLFYLREIQASPFFTTRWSMPGPTWRRPAT